MYYTIYEIRNIINDKVYIGKHKTTDLDDTYMGSGKILKRAIKKHGIDNFTKTYLFIFDNEDDMNNKEKEIVNESFIKEDSNYNLNLGGDGGWSFININGLNHLHDNRKNSIANLELGRRVGKTVSPYAGAKISSSLKSHYKNNGSHWVGKRHSEESKELMSKSNTHQKGSNNSQYGTMWIHSLELKVSKRINKNDDIPEGWYKGRKIKF